MKPIKATYEVEISPKVFGVSNRIVDVRTHYLIATDPEGLINPLPVHWSALQGPDKTKEEFIEYGMKLLKDWYPTREFIFE